MLVSTDNRNKKEFSQLKFQKKLKENFCFIMQKLFSAIFQDDLSNFFSPHNEIQVAKDTSRIKNATRKENRLERHEQKEKTLRGDDDNDKTFLSV